MNNNNKTTHNKSRSITLLLVFSSISIFRYQIAFAVILVCGVAAVFVIDIGYVALYLIVTVIHSVLDEVVLIVILIDMTLEQLVVAVILFDLGLKARVGIERSRRILHCPFSVR